MGAHNTCILTRATLTSVNTKKSLTRNRRERRTPVIRAKVLKSAEGRRLPATNTDGTKTQKRRSGLIEYKTKILTMRAEPAFRTRSASDLREKRRGREVEVEVEEVEEVEGRGRRTVKNMNTRDNNFA